MRTSGWARAGFNYANDNFVPYYDSLPTGGKPLAVWAGNDALAMGGAAGRRKVLLRLPDESLQRRPALDGAERPQPGHYGAPGGG